MAAVALPCRYILPNPCKLKLRKPKLCKAWPVMVGWPMARGAQSADALLRGLASPGWTPLRKVRMTRAALLCLLLASAAHAAPPDPGNTLRLLATSGAGTIDPQINYTAQYGQIFAQNGVCT